MGKQENEFKKIITIIIFFQLILGVISKFSYKILPINSIEQLLVISVIYVFFYYLIIPYIVGAQIRVKNGGRKLLNKAQLIMICLSFFTIVQNDFSIAELSYRHVLSPFVMYIFSELGYFKKRSLY